MSFSDIFNAGKIKKDNQRLFAENKELIADNQNLSIENERLNRLYSEIGAATYEATVNAISLKETQLRSVSSKLDALRVDETSTHEKVRTLSEQATGLEKKITSLNKKSARLREIQKSIDWSVSKYFEIDSPLRHLSLPPDEQRDLDELVPTVMVKLHSMDVKDLRKCYRENEKQIQSVLESYLPRYTTKTNRSLYQLMVIALRSEMQNILSNLKYEKLDTAIEKVQSMSRKYLELAAEGNQSIAPTITKFIGQIEYLFINSVKIEYNYYVKKEQARQEQLAIREQMRVEAEERKALEAEKKKVEKEEAKYKDEIAKLREQLEAVATSERTALNARIATLEAQLASVIIKKDEIINLQNGKAGNIYIISNVGSFGDDVFKIGMTRRLDPQDRINELGSASVPFKFDVHSFIFSDDAVGLEKKLHSILNSKRVNKVNLRKEFFRVSLDELENIVNEIDPTAEFNRTMAAEEYRQSLSSDELYTSDYISDYSDDEDGE